MFIYIEIVKTEYYQREKMKINKKQLNNNDRNINNEKRNKRQKSTAPGIPRRSPTQVLIGLDVASLR